MNSIDQNETEQILKRHRQERKELQAKIQALKKQAPKGKKKKEIADSVIQLEKELEERHNHELSSVESLSKLSESNSDTDEHEEEAVESRDNKNTVESIHNEEAEEITVQEGTRVSRAQKRRNKKVNEEKERDKRILEQAEKNKKGPRVTETNKIKELLQDQGLQLYNIPADGNCLYCAVDHQLEITGRESLSVEKLRKITADFMKENKDDFIPFMCNDSDEPLNEKQFEEYCKSVAATKFWGGQIEIKALSNALKCPIKIIQASGPHTIQGENFTGPPLILTYHRHLYRLGEHYNSTSLHIAQDSEELSS